LLSRPACSTRSSRGAEEVAATENEIREAVREGVSPLEAYDRYGIF
jgi:hypothetical protein